VLDALKRETLYGWQSLLHQSATAVRLQASAADAGAGASASASAARQQHAEEHKAAEQKARSETALMTERQQVFVQVCPISSLRRLPHAVALCLFSQPCVLRAHPACLPSLCVLRS
jgi:hypothetical protein